MGDSELYLNLDDLPIDPEPTQPKPKRPSCGACRNVCGTCRSCGLSSDRIDGMTHFSHAGLIYCAECCAICGGTNA